MVLSPQFYKKQIIHIYQKLYTYYYLVMASLSKKFVIS